MFIISSCCFDKTWIHKIKPLFSALQFQAFPSLKHNLVCFDLRVVETIALLPRCH